MQKFKPRRCAYVWNARHQEVVEIWIERSRLRSCDVAPGPVGTGFWELTTLYRPVGDAELRLIEESGHRRFPPRRPEQPFFYPVLSEDYAAKVRDVGGREHSEYCVPTEDLNDFNESLKGRIDVIAEFRGAR